VSYYGGGVAYLDDYEIVETVATPQLREVYDDFVGNLQRWLNEPYTRDASSAVPEADASAALLEQVASLHASGKPSAAADCLLSRIVDLLDVDDFVGLDRLIDFLDDSLQKQPELYDARGLARIHNVLAISFDVRERLPHRAGLKSRYREAVAKQEGSTAAERATELL
jgi:hypothetical protein